MRSSLARKLLVILLLVPMILGLAACTQADIDFLRELAVTWLLVNGKAVGSYYLWGSSGNAEVDAVLDARTVIDNMREAETLMEDGRKEGDLDKMAEAIEKRPGDYTYRVSFAAEAWKQGYTDDAMEQFQAGDQFARQYGGSGPERFAIQSINELSLAGQPYVQNGFKDTAHCQAYYSQMSYLYGMRFQQTGTTFFRDQKADFQAKAATCP